MIRSLRKNQRNQRKEKRPVAPPKRSSKNAAHQETPEPLLPFRMALLLILLAALLPYLNTFGNQFVYDDVALIQHDPRVVQKQPLIEAFKGDAWRETKPGSRVYRPLFTLSLMLNYRMAGESVWTYHLYNLIFHAAASLLVYLLALRLVSPFTSFAAALLFAAHPVHTEAVTWISGRAEAMSAVFVLFALLASLRALEARGRLTFAWMAAAIVSMLLGLLSKESAIMTPVLFLLMAAYLRKKWPARREWRLALPLWILAAIYAGARIIITSGLGAAPEGQVLAHYSLLERLVVACGLFWKYLLILLFPYPLTVEYYYPPVPPEWSAFHLIAPAALVFLVILLAVIGWKQSGVIVLLGWFLASLLPVLNLLPIGEVQAERFLYLPSAGFCAALAGLLVWGLRSNPLRWAAVTGIILLYCMSGLVRNMDWRNEETLWASAARVSRNSPLAQRRHGEHLLLAGNPEKALVHFLQAKQVEPGNWENHERTALALSQLGRHAEALDSYRRAEALNRNSYNLYFNLGNTCRELKQWDEAAAAYQRAIELEPRDAESRYNLAVTLAQQDKTDEARRAYDELLSIHPDHHSARHNLANLYRRSGDLSRAIAEFRIVLEMDPKRARTWKYLSMALWDSGDRAGAIEAKMQVAALEPSAESLSDLGYAYFKSDKMDEARQCYETALAKWPDDGHLLYRLAALEAKEGQIEKGLESLKKALASKTIRAVDIFDDPDLEPLRADPRFAEILVEKK